MDANLQIFDGLVLIANPFVGRLGEASHRGNGIRAQLHAGKVRAWRLCRVITNVCRSDLSLVLEGGKNKWDGALIDGFGHPCAGPGN